MVNTCRYIPSPKSPKKIALQNQSKQNRMRCFQTQFSMLLAPAKHSGTSHVLYVIKIASSELLRSKPFSEVKFHNFLALSLSKSISSLITTSLLLTDCSSFQYSNGVRKDIAVQIEIRLHNILTLYIQNISSIIISIQTSTIILSV